MERFCPNGWGCKHFPMEGKRQRGYSQCDSVVPASVASPEPFHCSVTDHEKQTILWFSPLISSAYSACQWKCMVLMLLGSFQRAEQLGFRLVQCLVTLSHWYFLGRKKKKGIKTPTTLNTRSGHVSHGSLANYQMCILLSGIFLAVNTCSCLLVLKWYVIMNFPKEMGMS